MHKFYRVLAMGSTKYSKWAWFSRQSLERLNLYTLDAQIERDDTFIYMIDNPQSEMYRGSRDFFKFW